jgi:hypothetical protein
MYNLNDDIEALIRQHYITLYLWHKENGRQTIDKIKASNKQWNRENNNPEEYQLALREIPDPEKASLAQIKNVADKVRSGILEFNYGATGNNDLPLGETANRILILFNEIERSKELEHLKETVFEVIDHEIKNDHDYFEKAAEVYSPVFLDNNKNIGGRVVMADTNWEIQKNSNLGNRVLFRKSGALNMKEINESDNTFQLALEEKISILSINIRP